MAGVLHGEARRLRCIAAVDEEGARFGALARDLQDRAALDDVVPWIPAWRARDLVGHLGSVHRWAAYILRTAALDAPPPEARPAPPDDGLLDWYAEGHAELVETLHRTPADSPAWHMSPAAGRTAADWARRQAHELVVHRMDLERTAGVPHAPVPADLAEDGVDELLTVVVPRWAHTEPLVGATATVAVRCRDTGAAWWVRVDRGVVTVGRDGSPPSDAGVEGRATDLLLHLWGRPADAVTVTGDRAAEGLLRGR
jgi:uncharacterized protein (TIGR03083 family)